MRIISGIWKGKKLIRPPENLTRPTSDRARQAIFNVIEHNYSPLEDCIIADLCSGSGAMGIEAISRGARFATFVENNDQVISVLKQNIAHLNAFNKAQIMNKDIKNLPTVPYQYHYIFIDPPYNLGLEQFAMEQLVLKNWVNKETVICLETEASHIPQHFSYFTKIDERQYGRAGFSFWRF